MNEDLNTPHPPSRNPIHILMAEDAMEMLAQTGCDAVMVGRAAIGNPMLFTQILDRLDGRPAREVTQRNRIDMMTRYLKTSVKYLGEKKACYMLRSRLGWFVKGMPKAGGFRNGIRHLSSEAEALGLINAFSREILPSQCPFPIPT